MSRELETVLERAVGELEPPPVDTDAIWRRGRRQRVVRQAGPAAVVVVIVAIGLGAVVGLAGRPAPSQPLDGIEDGRAPAPGWTLIAPGSDVAVDDVVAARDDDVEVVTPLPGHPGGPHLTDVRRDGAVVTIFQDVDRGGIVVLPPGGGGWTRLGMPVPFLTTEAGFAITTVQWGPDDRIYVTGTAPGGAARGRGLSQVVVLEDDGTVVGSRENDDGQTAGFLFADGYAWQPQTAGPDRQRWQPVVEIGGRVLPMPEQRAGDVDGELAPDGLALAYDLDDRRGPTFAAQLADGDTVGWRQSDAQGVGVWNPTTAGLRVATTVPMRPVGGPLGWLRPEEAPDGLVLHALRADGRIAAVHLSAELIPEPWSLVNGGDAAIGGDGRVYWVSHTPAGPMLFRYRHPIP